MARPERLELPTLWLEATRSTFLMSVEWRTFSRDYRIVLKSCVMVCLRCRYPQVRFSALVYRDLAPLKIVAASFARVDIIPFHRLLAPLDNQVKSNIIPPGFQQERVYGGQID